MRPTRFATVLASLGAVCAVFFCVAGCSRERAVPSASPVPGSHVEALVGFVKHQSCQPTACGDFVCETFSDGQAKGLPSHVARCRWTDSIAAEPRRCAYVHYTVDSGEKTFTNLFLSSTFSKTCATDKEFSVLIKSAAGYSGRVPD